MIKSSISLMEQLSDRNCTPIEDKSSLADVKVSARQQCAYEGPLEKKIYSKSTICDSCCGLIVTVPVSTTVCKIFMRIEVENLHFHLPHSDCRPRAEERPAIST